MKPMESSYRIYSIVRLGLYSFVPTFRAAYIFYFFTLSKVYMTLSLSLATFFLTRLSFCVLFS